MSYRDFEYAFVHRFGSHGNEAPEEIMKRKQNERPLHNRFRLRQDRVLTTFPNPLAEHNQA